MHRQPGRALKLALALGIVALVLPVHLRPQNFPTDDAFFYLQVAHHIDQGHGSTFNEITRTNGYHPLWMLFCVGASRLAGGDKQLTLHIALAVQQLLFGGILLLLHRLAGRLRLQYDFVGVPLLAAALLATANHGVESSLNGLAICSSLLGLEAAVRSGRRAAWLGAGVLLGLCILARLDNVFLVAALTTAAVVAAGRGFGHGAPRLFLCLLALSGLVLPYLLWNVSTFAHWMPISGAIKSRFPALGLHVESLGGIGIAATLGGVAALLASRLLHGSRRWLMAGMGSGVGLHGTYMLLFVHDNVLTWTWVAGMVNLALLVILAAEALVPRLDARLGTRAARGCVAAAALTVLGLAASRVWSDFYNPEAHGANPFQFRRRAMSKWQNDIALWLGSNLPAGTRFFAQHWPGAIAYYSDRPCLPEDGLMGDYDYDHDLLALGIENYLESRNVRLFLGPYPPWVRRGDGWARAAPEGKGWRVDVRTPLTRQSAGSILLREDDLLVRFDASLGNPSMPSYGLWRLPLRQAVELGTAPSAPEALGRR